MNVDDIISRTVDETILKLKMAGLMKNETQSTFQKTEQILRNYKTLSVSHSENGTAEKFIAIVNSALELIKDDSYYDLIPMIYFEGRSREEVAEFFNTSTTTISRNKTRLINKLKIHIFTDDVVKELFL